MTASLFAPLDRLLEKYKQDVNRLAGPASPEALVALEAHLGQPLPTGLRTFLERYNGAQLLRGAIRVRNASETARASTSHPQVVLFAEVNGDIWAWSPDGHGGWAFGEWANEQLHPRHATFAGWLRAAISVTEARVTRENDRVALRFEADRSDAYQLLDAGVRALHEGDPDSARQVLERATQLPATAVCAWQRLGETLAVVDRSEARRAWKRALDLARLPLPYPGAPTLDPDVFRSLSAAYTNPEDHERDLLRFMGEQVGAIGSDEEGALLVACGREVARSRLKRGSRTLARDALQDLVARCAATPWGQVPWAALLDLARLEVDLGHHDAAESHLRRIRRDGPADLQGPGKLLNAQVALTREEPWAEELLDEAVAAGLDDEGRALAAALHVERAVRRERLPEAARWLDRATAACREGALPVARARLALVRGDLERAAGDLSAARAAYEGGLIEIDRQDEPELRFRLHLRLADVAIALGQRERAFHHARTAAEGFAAAELPVREGWALVRLARLIDKPEQALYVARQRFEVADLAAGVAAVDAASGQPGMSLEWHVLRATAHARACHDARRSRPPWERADAERPERRLGAHRMAIASCGPEIVERLSAELENNARAIATGRLRAVDTPVLRYVAAVDLLSGHRSWEAGQVLLEHLTRQNVTGAARKALQGAVARSPNASLVDGLLRCVEAPHEHPASVVAEAAEALGLRREASALGALVRLADRAAHPMSRKAAITALARIGDRSVVDAIMPALEDPTLEAPAALALLMLGDRRGVDFHARALTQDRTNLSFSPGEIVGRYGGPTHLLLLVHAASGQGEGAKGALQGLGLLGDPRAVPTLLESLDRRDREVQEVAAGALQILTGHAEQVDDPGWKTRWNVWWERESANFRSGVRYRGGRVFEPAILLDRMEDSDPWTRRTAHDELVITSGQNLPFDAEGPWRTQQTHLRAWRAWWQEVRRSHHPGRWYLDGQPIV
jgi:HEAT repeat protein/tetratricopeptide (TPR) repeat protein